MHIVVVLTIAPNRSLAPLLPHHMQTWPASLPVVGSVPYHWSARRKCLCVSLIALSVRAGGTVVSGQLPVVSRYAADYQL